MRSTSFLPSILANTDEFYAERTSLLMYRSLAGLGLALICTIAAMTLVYIRDLSEYWFLIIICVFSYIFPLRTCFGYLRSKPQGIEQQKAKVRSFTWQVLCVVVVWNLLAMPILPSLDAETRVIAICLFIATVFSHFLAFTLFPRIALVILVVNLVPLSLQLTFLGDYAVVSLGLAGIVLACMEVMLITWLFRADMDILRREKNKNDAMVSEPDTVSYTHLRAHET